MPDKGRLSCVTGKPFPDEILGGQNLDEHRGGQGDPRSRIAEPTTPHDTGPPGGNIDPQVAHHPPGDAAADHSNRRAGPRHQLLYRVARLVDDELEMLCILRDISPGGLCAQIFGEAELPERLEIALADDRHYRIDKAWQAGERCGFRFGDPVDVGDFLAAVQLYPSKRGLRLRTDQPVTVTDDAGRMPAGLLDISVQGAKLAFADRLPSPGRLLEIEIPELGTKQAEIRWMTSAHAGVKFREEISFNRLAEWSAARWIGLQPALHQRRFQLKRRA